VRRQIEHRQLVDCGWASGDANIAPGRPIYFRRLRMAEISDSDGECGRKCGSAFAA
jgi:hypothetical protein